MVQIYQEAWFKLGEIEICQNLQMAISISILYAEEK